MKDELRRVLALQMQYTAANSPAMTERGDLVLTKIPERIKRLDTALASQLRIPLERLVVKGSNGQIKKNQVPWVRIADRIHSPSTTSGWYCCLLFNGTGSCVWLALMQGANTPLPSGDYRQRDTAELLNNVDWARDLLADAIEKDPALVTAVDLEADRSKVAHSYELATALSICYPFESVPDDNVLEHDLLYFVGLLQRVYAATDASSGEARDSSRIAYIVARYVDALLTELRETPGDTSLMLAGIDQRMLEAISTVLVDSDLPILNSVLPLKDVDPVVRSRIKEALKRESTRIPDRFRRSEKSDVVEHRVSMLVAARPVRRPPAIERPAQKRRTITCVVRSAEVVAWVLNRAQGRCEHCNAQAPFMRWDEELGRERPYLEVHHVHRLADDGPDSVQNAVALCPNCHRRCHHSTDRDKVREVLEDYLAEVEAADPPPVE